MKYAADVEGCKINAGLKRLSRYCESPDYVAGIQSLSSFLWFGCFKCGLVVLLNWQPTAGLCCDSWLLHKVIPCIVARATQSSENCFRLGHLLLLHWPLITIYLVRRSPASSQFTTQVIELYKPWTTNKWHSKQIDLLKPQHVNLFYFIHPLVVLNNLLSQCMLVLFLLVYSVHMTSVKCLSWKLNHSAVALSVFFSLLKGNLGEFFHFIIEGSKGRGC